MNALCAKDTVVLCLLTKHNALVWFFENISLDMWINVVIKFVY